MFKMKRKMIPGNIKTTVSAKVENKFMLMYIKIYIIFAFAILLLKKLYQY